MIVSQTVLDGEAFAYKVYSELLKRKELSSDDILSIMDSLEFPLFRKSELIAWRILEGKSDVLKTRDEKGRLHLLLVDE